MTVKQSGAGSGARKIMGHLAALLTVTAWGVSFLSTKVLMGDGGMSPVEVFVYRFALAYFVLLAFTFRDLRSQSWRDELQLALCGICSGTFYFILENYALGLTSTSNVSLLSGVSPILTAILIAVVYRQRLKGGVIIGSIVAMAGVCCVIFAPSIAAGLGFRINPLGDLLALASAFSWAIYSVFVKRLTPLYSTFFITRKMFFYGVLTALPLLLLQKGPLHFGILLDFSHPGFLLNLLFLALICSLMAYIFWNESMKMIGPVATNNYIYLQPVVTMIAAYFFFSEPVYPLGIIGCFLVIGGLVVSDKLNFESLGRRRPTREN